MLSLSGSLAAPFTHRPSQQNFLYIIIWFPLLIHLSAVLNSGLGLSPPLNTPRSLFHKEIERKRTISAGLVRLPSVTDYLSGFQSWRMREYLPFIETHLATSPENPSSAVDAFLNHPQHRLSMAVLLAYDDFL